MRVSIARRFGITLALIGILAAGLTGYKAFSTSRALLVKAAEERLLTATRVLIRQLVVELDDTSREVRLIAGHPRALAALTDSDAANRKISEDEMAALFSGMLKTHPEFFQIRLIAAADHGMERVRLDRDQTGSLRVSGDDLQEKGHFAYVFDTLRLKPGSVYISTPVINHELGAHAGEGKPSIHMAAPIYGHGSTPVGLVVINVDLNGLFKQLAADLPQGIGLYLTNGQGDFLIHPDPAQAFAFDVGKRIRVQDQFPATAVLFDGNADHVVTTVPQDGEREGGVVAAFAKVRVGSPPEARDFTLGLSQPTTVVLRQSNDLGFATLRIVLAFSVLSVLLAIIFARAITGPLNQMVAAVRDFAAEGKRVSMPVARADEVGLLARTFDDMQQQIALQIDALQGKQRELDYLASHDALTGLPNRRLFQDRLDHAIAHVRRHNEQIAILFIDLDHFKDINDSLGHVAGDTVLQTVAAHMRAIVRETDTVARLGGDEFIILVENAGGDEELALIALKILDALAKPVVYQERPLDVGASIGISRYPLDGDSAIELIAAADQAMYRAKCSGRNRYCFASAGKVAADSKS